MTIGDVARRTGLPVRTIRFYEASGVVPHVVRSPAGYRLYSPTDVRRLRLAGQARSLGLSLPEVKVLVHRAFNSECTAYLDELLGRIATQRERAEQQLRALRERRTSLDALERHARRLRGEAEAGRRVVDCACCPLIDQGVTG
ncbi:MAG TPA: MerR family transcriptional regulator [Dehalococcoidia bacterium]|nr:MerR family transcriptional regulator [Dehalococcoidia bacterium]